MVFVMVYFCLIAVTSFATAVNVCVYVCVTINFVLQRQ